MVNRITGFTGVLDIDGTVKKLMDAERMPLDKLKGQKQIMEWQTQQYRDMNLLMDDLRNSLFSGLGMQSTFNVRSVVSTNDSIVSAVSNGGSSKIVNSIDSITQLATSARWTSSQILKDDGAAGTAIDINAAFNTYSLKTSSGTYPDPAAPTTYPANLGFTVTKPGETTSSNVTIAFDPSKDSLQTLINSINSSNLGVSAFYDQGTQKMVISNLNTGSGSKIELDSQTEQFFNALGFSTTSGVLDQSSAGKDASFVINGLAMTRSSNTFTVGDLTYTLKQTTTSPVSISASTDTSNIFDSIKSFVDKYNDMIKKINDKISEKRYRDFQPLTDAQRDSMKDDQIKSWEEKAQSGLIRNDSILSGVLNKIRTDLGGAVSGLTTAFKTLSDIGITTSPNYLDNGKLIINEAKLKNAITNDSNAVANLFTTDSTTSSNQGFATRLKNSLKTAMDNITLKAGKSYSLQNSFTIGRNMADLDTRISKFEDRLTVIEDRYYRQFNAMEQAIDRSNKQASYFAQSFGG